MKGLIVRTHNRFYHVRVDDKIYVVSPKGKFRRGEDPQYRLPVIGDTVSVDLELKDKGVDGYITEIEERRNGLARADQDGRRERIMAANIDLAMVVSAVVKPGVDFALIDRYILSLELCHIPYALLINKIELDPSFSDDPDLEAYRQLDIPVLEVSAKTDQGLDELKSLVQSGISYLTGASGVGKSTLINRLVPEADLATGAVDVRKGRGKHTTTYSTLVPTGDHGFLVDSPGLRDFYPPKVPPEDVRFGYREIAAAQANCRFNSCLHDGEPDCAVWPLVESGQISAMRFKSYLFNMREMKEYFQNRY